MVIGGTAGFVATAGLPVVVDCPSVTSTICLYPSPFLSLLPLCDFFPLLGLTADLGH